MALLALVLASGLSCLALDPVKAQVPVIVEVEEEESTPGAPSDPSGEAPGAPGDDPSGEAPGSPGALPRTGMDVVFAVSLALLLIGGGVVLIDASRRSERSLREERNQS